MQHRRWSDLAGPRSLTGATRNLLIVLPLRAACAVTPPIVVAQTLVELAGMLAYIRLVRRLILVSASVRTDMASAT